MDSLALEDFLFFQLGKKILGRICTQAKKKPKPRHLPENLLPTPPS